MNRFNFTISVTFATISLLSSSLLPLPVIKPVLAQKTQESVSSKVYNQSISAIVTIKNGKSHGTGFLVSVDGLIITNAHVVADGPRVVTVKFNDGTQVSADVLGFAKDGVDLAVLQIYPNKKLSFLPLGDGKSINVGQPIFVIGTPLEEDYQGTLTEGIISRIDDQKGKIQHNANTSPGNSGSPVLNQQGEVIAVHSEGDLQSAVYDPEGNKIGTTKSGINFAVSLDRLRKFLTDMRSQDIAPDSTLVEAKEEESIIPITLNNQVIKGQLTKKGNYANKYQFKGTAGQKIIVEMNSEDIDSFLRLSRQMDSSDSTQLEEITTNNDRGPGNFNARIVTTLPNNGIYIIETTSLSGNEIGNYTLKVSTTP
jgi:serine protease Do